MVQAAASSIKNSIDFAPEGNEMIQCKKSGPDQILFHVKNNGRSLFWYGMDKKTRSRNLK